MRLKIYLIAAILLCCINGYGQHDNLQTDIHKYLTYEAWGVVKLGFPHTAHTEMNARIGENWSSPQINGTSPWQVGTIVTGAYREDVEDAVFGYLEPNNTSTHFWDADAGIDSKFTPPWPYNNHDYENSFVKLTAYWNGRVYGQPFVTLGPYYKNGTQFYVIAAFLNNDGTANYPGTPTTLDEVYKDRTKLKAVARMVITGNDPVIYPTMPYPSIKQYLQTAPSTPMSNEYCDNLVQNVCWEIVGRMCHLIEDSGVPAHAHNNAHPFDSDHYENNYSPLHYTEYTRIQALQQSQALYQTLTFPLTNKNNPLLYTIYLTNQIADRFGSNGCVLGIGGCDVVPGDTQYLDYTPQVPGETRDYVRDVIQSVYNAIGPSIPTAPYYIDNVYSSYTMKYSFVFSMRTTASFLWYVYQKFGIQPSPEPVIYNITPTLPDNNVFLGETQRLTCNTNNVPNMTYSWDWSVCEPGSSCSSTIPGVTVTPNGKTLMITNTDYHSLTCSCTNTDLIPSARYYKVKVTATAPNWPPITTEYLYNVVPLQGPRNIGGCPYAFVQNEEGKFISENNLLHRSEFADLAGQDISDRYLLTVKPGVFDNKISVNLYESTNDISSINSIKLFAIDHPAGTKIGVTENNDIVMYYDEDVESPKNATKNHIENITGLIQYNSEQADRHDTVSGIPTDDIISDFDIPTLRAKMQTSIGKYNVLKKRSSKRGSSDSTAIIMKMGLNPNLDRPPVRVSRRPAGNISITADAAGFSTQFARRENPSNVIIPFGPSNTSIEKANIDWDRDYELYFAVVVNVFYDGFEVSELPLVEALNTANDNLLTNLQDIDKSYATLDTTGIIMLKFDSQSFGVNNGMIRDYILETNGQYSTDIVPSARTQHTSKDVTKNTQIAYSNKLDANFPNPFNPTTKINYQIKRDGFVSLKIYNVVGQLVKELVGEFKNAGNYIVEFNGSHLASGTYYYRIESNDFVETKKMILIK